VTANTRFEVFGRKRLRIQPVSAKDLQMGDQVILLQDDERSAFSERLLQAMDEGRLKTASSIRSQWIAIAHSIRTTHSLSVNQLKDRLESLGIHVDATTIRTWLRDTADECGVPDKENVFLGLAQALGVTLPLSMLKEWFTKINGLRIEHRKIGRALARAIRGAYSGRLDPVTIARMERDWGVQTKTLLDAVRVAIVDDVVHFDRGAA
jgi:hypothetical protein